MEFDEAFARLGLGDRGWLRDPHDPGNWTGGEVGQGELRGTKFGISAAQYPAVDIEHLTIGMARALYLADVWMHHNCEQLPGWCRWMLFDALVNHPAEDAVRWLQRAAGTREDGTVGVHTVAAVRESDPWRTIAMFHAARLDCMAESALWPHQGRQWARRVACSVLGAEV